MLDHPELLVRHRPILAAVDPSSSALSAPVR